ncbi:phosphotransferase [Paenibacillus albus]|uniref:Aminoglycoside phosphotransferase family protein n=1 Tax=Paenibacillus albus TaxID=2495582 RepID=A0A3S9A6P7_9BACL|nr:phosphotransferase [Paenibacillus albus]AZN41381.1 aminoglycoside phosphotransferase family protein [Paenibacillus albus]
MSEIQYNIQFTKLCQLLQLGELIGIPEAISGGLLHRMYRVETDQGTYAVKALNPQIMMRPTAMSNYMNSERIANLAAAHVPALPAKQYNGTSVQEVENQYYLVFEWIEGRSLRLNEITPVHSEQIGRVVAGIQKVDFSVLGIPNHPSSLAPVTNWSHYLQQGEGSHSLWVNLLGENKDLLHVWNTQANDAAEWLESDKVISHGDLDAKNVMWNQDRPIIIDWEASGYVNPMSNVIETAIYWSETETGVIDKERFAAFMRGYKMKCGPLHANWKVVLAYGFLGKLGWLEYNLKRSLGIECTDEAEQQMGTEQVIATINAIKSYADQIPVLEEWLNEEL